MSTRWVSRIITGLLLLAAGAAQAQTYVFTNYGAGIGSWTNTTNYAGGVAPVSGGNLVFTNSTTPISIQTTNDFANNFSFGWVDFQGPQGSTNRSRTSANNYYFSAITNEATSTNTTFWIVLSSFTNTASSIVNNGGKLVMTLGLTNAGVMTLDGSGILTNSGVIAGAGSWVKNGGGTWQVTGVNTFGGGITLNSGTNVISGNSAIGTGIYTINGGVLNALSGGVTNANGNTLIINSNFVFAGSKNLDWGTGPVTVASNATISVNANNLYLNGPLTVGDGSLNALDISKAGAGTLAIGSTTPITLRSAQTNTITAGTLALMAPIDDGGNNYALTTVGGGTLQLSASNSYGGLTIIGTGATLRVNNNYALGSTAAGTVVQNTGLLLLGNNVTITGESLSLAGAGGTLGSLRVDNASTGTWAGPITIENASTRLGTADGAGVLTISGTISDGATNQLLISASSGTGKVILSGTNTYSGRTGLIRGTLVLGADNALPTNTVLDMRDSASVTDATIFDMNGHNQTLAVLTNKSTGAVTIMVTNSAVGPNTLTLNQNVDATYAYTIGGPIALVKNGTGTFIMNGTNTYSGGTTINSGSILFGNTNAMADATFLAGNGAGVGVTYAMDQDFLTRINPASVGVAVMGVSTVNNLDFNAAGLANVSLGAYGTVTNTGVITPNGGTYRLGGGGGTLTLVNADQLTGGNSLVALGGGSGGTVVLSASNSFAGGTLLSAGTVQVKDPNALGTGLITNNAALQFKNGSTITSALPAISGSGVVDYNGGNVTMLASNSYSGGTLISSGSARISAGNDNAFGSGPIIMSGSTSAISSTGSEARVLANNFIISNNVTLGNGTDSGLLTLNGGVDLGGAVRTVTISSPVTISGNLANGGLTKAGAATTLTLAGTNTYAGGTTLSAGTLSIGSYSNLPAAGGLTFSGGILQITGTEISDLSVYNPNWGSFNGGLDINNGAHSLTVTNDITLATVLTKAGAGSLTLYQATNGSFVASGGTLILTGTTDNANTYATVNNNATLVLAKDSSGAVHALNYSGSTLSSLLINNGGTVVLAGTGGDQIPDTGRPGIMTNNGVLDMNGNSEIIACMAGSGVTTNSSAMPGTLTINVGGNYTYSGAMLGAINVQTISNGTWTLSGNNNISGGVTNAGGAGGMTFSGNNTLGSVVNNTSGTTLLSGNNNLGSATVNAGTLTLSGSNAISSGVTLNAGTLNVNNTYALGAGLLVINGGTMDNTSAGTLTNDGGSSYQWNGDFTYKGTRNYALGVGAVTLGANVAITNTAGVLAIDGVIGDGAGGPYSLTKAGGGTLVLRNGNTFAGGLVLNAGTQRVEHAGALGAGTFTINSGVLDSYYGDLVLNPTPMTWNGNFSYAGTSNLNLGTGAITMSNNISLAVSARQLTIGGAIGDDGNGYSFTKTGNGKLVLTGASTYTGGTILPQNTGWVVLSNTTGVALQGNLLLGSVGGDAFLRLGANEQLATNCIMSFAGNSGSSQLGRFLLLGYSQTVGGLNDPNSNALVEVADNTGSGYASDTNAGPSSLTINVATATNYILAGYIRDRGSYIGPSNILSLVKDGMGTQTLHGSHILYTGSTTVRGGMLMLSNTTAFTSTVTVTGGQLALATANAGANNRVITNNAVNGLAFLNSSAFIIGGLSGNGSVALTNDAGAAVTLTNAGTGNFSGTLEGAGGLIISSVGNLTVSGVNTFGGGVKLNTGGRLNINSGNALGTGPLTLNGGVIDNTSGSPVTNANNNSIMLSNATFFSGSSSLHLGTGPMTIADGGHTVNVSNNVLTLGGVISDGATSASLTKDAGGILALTGINNYTGGTIINAGVLRANVGVGVPVGSPVDINGGLLETDATFTNAVGTGAGQVLFRGSTAGISAYGAPVTVNLGNAGSMLVVGASFGPGTLVLNDSAATDVLTFRNGLNLGVSNLTISVLANTAVMTGNLTNSTSTANSTFTKNGVGTLALTGNNYFNSNVTAAAGTLVLAGNTNTVLGALRVGNTLGVSAALLITNGGQVISSGSGYLGGTAGNNSNSAIVTGSTAAWSLNNLYVGSYGTGNWMRVDNGAMVSANQVRVGDNSSTFGNSLLITNGGQLSAASFIIGRNSLANNNGVYVGGAGATVNNSSRFDLGGYFSVTDLPNTQSGNYLIIDQGGVMTNTGIIYVGAATNAANNYLIVTNGGQLVSKSGPFIGCNDGGNTNWAYVGGNNAQWDLGGQTLTIGKIASATGNYLTVASGGVLTNGLLSLGGIGSAVKFNGGTLAAGASGNLISGSGTVYVQNGGASLDTAGFSVTNVLPFTEDPGSTGGGLAKFGNGTLTILTNNTYTGPTLVNAGTLAVGANGSLGSGGLRVANGATFDASAASGGFTLAGGQALTNNGTFLGGLIIASGATALGGGAYNGAVTNLAGGTLTPGVGGDTNFVQSLTLAGNSTNLFWLGNPATHDMTVVSNSLTAADLGHPLLKLDLGGYAPGGGGTIVLYNNLFTGMSDFNGTNQWFKLGDLGGPNNQLDLLNGTIFQAVGNTSATNTFTIRYDFNAGGDGQFNDIVLTVIPEPASVNLLLLLGAAYWLRRRRHGPKNRRRY